MVETSGHKRSGIYTLGPPNSDFSFCKLMHVIACHCMSAMYVFFKTNQQLHSYLFFLLSPPPLGLLATPSPKHGVTLPHAHPSSSHPPVRMIERQIWRPQNQSGPAGRI